jgi:predicted dehydrogenase
MKSLTRRDFLRQSCIGAAGLSVLAGSPAILRAAGTARRIVAAVIGCNGRGMDHIAALLSVPNLEIAVVCDVDARALKKGMEAVARRQQKAPQGTDDLRRVIENPDIDAVSIATPDHWHAPAAMLACAGGKHVYVEKPGSHNARESLALVSSARKHKRVVQMGNQRRSWPWVKEAIATLHQGELGKLFFARCWYTNRRGSIGRGHEAPVPDWLNYTLWQGPAPERPFRDNLVHYNWHWFWHWGTGELGNNGVHSIDLARWGLGVDLPKRIGCGGGRYHFSDDWETPDTAVATFDFGDKAIVWEGQSCDPRGFEGAGFGVNFYGEKGCLSIAGNQCRIFDPADKLVREFKGGGGDQEHFANFADGIREGKPLAAEIEEGQKSTLLCHLGNIAFRSGRTLNFDPVRREILGDKAAARYWGREYRKGWAPAV